MRVESAIAALPGRSDSGEPLSCAESARIALLALRAQLLSQLAVVDALLDSKEVAISEAKRAVELLPISKDALFGSYMEMNLAVAYAWSNELDLAFEKLTSLTEATNIQGIFYGQLKGDPYWEPLRKDPRYEKLLAELAPRD